ncbi:hypothetical protein GIB67_016177 [Kingdonia uniflora]|uniref:Uncharacterized protein n=1 Tax=Kingdonia uniflora TaxID=39325 RepID=A0A7J7N9K8_9MAGN|nr:hypothetical protein GIB67_016177 [Kingdonia uniflora]
MLKRPSTSGIMGSGETMKKRRVEPSEMSGIMIVEDRPIVEDALEEVEEKTMLAAHHGVEEMSKMAVPLMTGICLEVGEERVELKRKKVELKRIVARLKTNLLKEGKWMEALKALQVVEINNLLTEAMTNLKEVDVVDAIRVDTYVEEEEDEEIEDVAIGVIDGLDSVPHQTVKDNQGDYNEHPEGENEKGLKDIRPRLKDLEAELAKERDASASLLSLQAELQVKLQSAHLREDDARQCNQEFT